MQPPEDSPRAGREQRVSAGQGAKAVARGRYGLPSRGLGAARGQLTRDGGGGEAQQWQQERGQRGPSHGCGCGRRAARLPSAERPNPSHRRAGVAGLAGEAGGEVAALADPAGRSPRRAARGSPPLRNF